MLLLCPLSPPSSRARRTFHCHLAPRKTMNPFPHSELPFTLSRPIHLVTRKRLRLQQGRNAGHAIPHPMRVWVRVWVTILPRTRTEVNIRHLHLVLRLPRDLTLPVHQSLLFARLGIIRQSQHARRDEKVVYPARLVDIDFEQSPGRVSSTPSRSTS